MAAIGFTGPRIGMTRRQMETLADMLTRIAILPGRPFETLRMGDCIGADSICAALARELGFRIVAHPPIIDTYRAWFPADAVLDPLPYLERNRVIVDTSRVLFATPATATPPTRGRLGGTWYTVGYADRRRLLTYLISPDGTVAVRHRPMTAALF